MYAKQHARRALLYVPGSDLHKIEKSATLDVDCVAMDLEDGVADNRKDEARQIIASALQEVNFGRSERVVRVNGFPSGRTEADLASVLPAHPDAILLPKVNSPAQVQRINELLVAAEYQYGWPPQSIALIVIVESARGMINLDSICQQSERFPRFVAVVFGAEDFTADMGATRTAEATELLYARSRLVMYCAAYGLQAIDLVTVNFKDEAVLEKEAVQGAQMGYTGKQIIHPAQIGPVQRIFTPSEKEIEWARQIVISARQYNQQGQGAFVFDGAMVDAPVIKRAELILARAQVEVD